MNAKSTPSDPEDPCSLAIIEGALCRVNRKGRTVLRSRPMSQAVEQFEVLHGNLVIVREQPVGFLRGFSNLSCLDSSLRVRWFAELPSDDDLYAAFSLSAEGVLTCTSLSGLTLRLDLETGRVDRSGLKTDFVAA